MDLRGFGGYNPPLLEEICNDISGNYKIPLARVLLTYNWVN